MVLIRSAPSLLPRHHQESPCSRSSASSPSASPPASWSPPRSPPPPSRATTPTTATRHHGSDSSDCNVTGGSSEANGGIDGDSFLGNALVQAPIGGANVANIVCNDILNDNLSGNNVAVSVLGGALPI